MACRCFLYESDRVWERNADQTMWGERKPKGGNLKTTPPSEIFTTAAQEEQERKKERRKKRQTEEEGERQASTTVRGAKDAAKAGEKQRCLYLLTILCPSSWIIEQMDWGLLNIHTKALGHQCCFVCVCVSSVWYTLLYIFAHTGSDALNILTSKHTHTHTHTHTQRFFCNDHPNHTRARSCLWFLFVCVCVSVCVCMNVFTLGTGLVIMNWYGMNKTSQCGLDPSWVYTHRDFTRGAAERGLLLLLLLRLLLLLLLSVPLPTVCLCGGWLCLVQIGTDTHGRKGCPHVLTHTHTHTYIHTHTYTPWNLQAGA